MAKAKGAPKKAQGKTKAAKKANGKKAPAKPQAEKKANGGNGRLAELKKEVEKAKKHMNEMGEQAMDLRTKAKEMEQAAKQAYVEAVAPYRAECKRTGAECEFAGGKSAPVAPRVRFLLSKEKEGIRVTVKGRPETEKLITNAELDASVGKASLKYCEAMLGPASEQGAKHAGLSHRMRQLIKQS